MLMNSKYDGYVFGQATSPAKRKQLVIAARKGHPGARAIVRAQNQLHGFGNFGDDEDEQGSGIKTGDGSDANGWPESDPEFSPPPPPPAPPPSGGSVTLNDIKGYGSTVVQGAKDAVGVYQDIKSTVAPVASQVGSPDAQRASTVQGNGGAANPQRIASAVASFRAAVAAFISAPSANNFNNSIAAWHAALDAYSDDAGTPPIGTGTIIARIIAALNVAASRYEDMYNYWVKQNANKAGAGAGEGGYFVPSQPAAARMASLTAREGAPSAQVANDLYANAGLPTAQTNQGGGSSSGMGIGTIALALGAAFVLLR